MRRLIRLIALAALITLAAAAFARPVAGLPVNGLTAQQQDEKEQPEEQHEEEENHSDVFVSSCAHVPGICVRVAERRSIAPVKRPGVSVGPVVLCVWYRYGTAPGGWDDPNGAVAVSWRLPGHLYVLMCTYEGSALAVSGYPRVVLYQYPGNVIPGQVVAGYEIAEHAKNRLGLRRPTAAIAPAPQQLVGTETWFAVTSPLHYPERSAQAGHTWATVRADVSQVTWDFGAHGRLQCSVDMARRWNPSLSSSQQNSACTKVFTDVSPGRFNAVATVTWDIWWSSSEHYGWRYHSSYSLSSYVPLNIVQLQAVIR